MGSKADASGRLGRSKTMSAEENRTEALLPLAVDLDGTLMRSDALYESLRKLLSRSPLCALLIPFWLAKGRAYLKRQIARRAPIDVSTLPYREEIVEYLRSQRNSGRKLVLATASDSLIAQEITSHLGLFDEVFASDGQNNLKGPRKAAKLAARFGHRRFSYLGNGREDLAVWRAAGTAVVISDDRKLADSIQTTTSIEKVFPAGNAGFRSLLKALRLHQWVKNSLVFVPLIAAHRVDDLLAVAETGLAFIAFGLVASAGYLLNDLTDVEADRHHSAKKNRPFASGALDLRAGFVGVPALLVVGTSISLLLPSAFTIALIAYFAASLIYSLYVKRIVLADVFMLAVLYTTRIIAGAVAIAVPTSQWLLAFSVFLFLSLAFVKRYSELNALRLKDMELAKGRGYLVIDFELLSSLGAASGYLAVLVFALYINSPEVGVLYRAPEYLWLFCLVLLYWISRVWIIAHRGQMHEDPIVFALKDRVSYGVGVAGMTSFILASI